MDFQERFTNAYYVIIFDDRCVPCAQIHVVARRKLMLYVHVTGDEG